MNKFTVRIVGPSPAGCATIIDCTDIQNFQKQGDCFYKLTTSLSKSGLQSLLANCAKQNGYPKATFDIS